MILSVTSGNLLAPAGLKAIPNQRASVDMFALLLKADNVDEGGLGALPPAVPVPAPLPKAQPVADEALNAGMAISATFLASSLTTPAGVVSYPSADHLEKEVPNEASDMILSSTVDALPAIFGPLAVQSAAIEPVQVAAESEPADSNTLTSTAMPLQPRIEVALRLGRMSAELAKLKDPSSHRADGNSYDAFLVSKAEASNSNLLAMAAPASLVSATKIEAALGIPILPFELRQLDLARDTQWLDDLAKDIAAAAKSEDQLSFRLSPRELGRLDVNLSTSDAGLSVKMLTANEDARAIVAAQQPRLLDELRVAGVRVAEAQVHTGGDRQRDRNSRDTTPFIEVAMTEEQQSDTPTPLRPQGRFA